METLRDALRWAYPRITPLLADVPWWAWAAAAAVALVLAALIAWWLTRLAGRAGRGVVEAVRRAAHGDSDARRRVRGVLANWSVLTALAASLAITSALGAVGIARVLNLHGGIPVPWNWAGVAVFQLLSIILMIMIAQRAEKALPAPGITAGFWATVGAEACFQLTHADTFVGKLLFASFSIIAGMGYHLLMHSKRANREQELKEAEGTWVPRRLGAVRWLHPIERIRVQLALAADEHLSADVATRQVREQAAVRRTARLERRAARAVWQLQRYQRAGKVAKVFMENPRRRAQSALDVAGVSRDQAMMAAVLRRVQLLSMADRLAELDYSDAEDARSLTAALITPEHLAAAPTAPHAPIVDAPVDALTDSVRAALETGGPASGSERPLTEPDAPVPERAAAADGPVAVAPSEEDDQAHRKAVPPAVPALTPESAQERVAVSAPAQLTLLTSPESDERVDERAQALGVPVRPAAPERAVPARPVPSVPRTPPAVSSAGRRERALALWLKDRSLTGAALARQVGASAATGSRWRREFEREYDAARARGLRVKRIKPAI
jgi:hypothetical protein